MSNAIQGRTLSFQKPFRTVGGSIFPAGRYHITAASIGRISCLELMPARDNKRIASSSLGILLFTAKTIEKMFGVKQEPQPANMVVAALPSGILKRTVRELFKQHAPRTKIDLEIDFDRLFKGLAAKNLNSYRRYFTLEDQDDIILDTLLQILNAKTIKAYKPEQNLGSYLGGMFQIRLKNVIRDRLARAKYEHQIPNITDGRSVDEYLETIDSRPQVTDSVNELEFKELLTDLHRFLRKEPEAKYYLPMLDLMLKGYTNKEIADEIGVSSTIISRYFGRLKEVLMRFAKNVNPDLAVQLAQFMNSNRQAAIQPAYPAGFQHYDPLNGGLQDNLIDHMLPYVTGNDRFLHELTCDEAPSDSPNINPADPEYLQQLAEQTRNDLLSTLTLLNSALEKLPPELRQARTAANLQIERQRFADPFDPTFRSVILMDPKLANDNKDQEDAFFDSLGISDDVLEEAAIVTMLKKI